MMDASTAVLGLITWDKKRWKGLRHLRRLVMRACGSKTKGNPTLAVPAAKVAPQQECGRPVVADWWSGNFFEECENLDKTTYQGSRVATAVSLVRAGGKPAFTTARGGWFYISLDSSGTVEDSRFSQRERGNKQIKEKTVTPLIPRRSKTFENALLRRGDTRRRRSRFIRRMCKFYGGGQMSGAYSSLRARRENYRGICEHLPAS